MPPVDRLFAHSVGAAILHAGGSLAPSLLTLDAGGKMRTNLPVVAVASLIAINTAHADPNHQKAFEAILACEKAIRNGSTEHFAFPMAGDSDTLLVLNESPDAKKLVTGITAFNRGGISYFEIPKAAAEPWFNGQSRSYDLKFRVDVPGKGLQETKISIVERAKGQEGIALPENRFPLVSAGGNPRSHRRGIFTEAPRRALGPTHTLALLRGKVKEAMRNEVRAAFRSNWSPRPYLQKMRACAEVDDPELRREANLLTLRLYGLALAHPFREAAEKAHMNALIRKLEKRQIAPVVPFVPGPPQAGIRPEIAWNHGGAEVGNGGELRESRPVGEQRRYIRVEEDVTEAEKAAIAKLIVDLGAPEYKVREQASKDLAETFGGKALRQLRQAAKSRDAEVRMRANHLMGLDTQGERLADADDFVIEFVPDLAPAPRPNFGRVGWRGGLDMPPPMMPPIPPGAGLPDLIREKWRLKEKMPVGEVDDGALRQIQQDIQLKLLEIIREQQKMQQDELATMKRPG